MRTGNFLIGIVLAASLMSSCKEKEVNPFVVIMFPSQGLTLPSKEEIYIKARIEPQGRKLISYEFLVKDESGKTLFIEKTEPAGQSPDVLEVSKTVPATFKDKTNLQVQVCASFDDGQYDCDSNNIIFDPTR